MRVLLPLRKVPANNHDSSSSLEEEEEAVGQQQPVATVATLAGPSAVAEALHPVGLDLEHFDSIKASVAAGRGIYEEEEHHHHHQNLGLARAFSEEEEGSWDEAGLRTSLVESLKELPGHHHKTSAFYRKRKASVDTADSSSKACKKRPALDRKPPARDLSNNNNNNNNNSSNMVGGRRRVYDYDDSDDCLRQASTDLEDDPLENDPLENNPASARGDILNNADVSFAVALKKRGLEIRLQDGDGNCLFRAVSLQVYGDPSMHNDVRQQCLDFMERDKEHFAQFVTGEPIEGYILRKRQNGVHGNNPEIQAISELFNRPVEVFCPDNGAVPLNIFHAEYKTADAPIRLSYHDGNHYNAVVDPLVPTAGLGLGLPGLQPGLADKMQVARAVTESDAVADQMAFKRALKESQDDELQRAIKESKLSAEHMHSNEALALSDMDATYFELEQAALVRSLQSHSSSEHGKKQRASSSSNRRRKHGRISPALSSSCDQSELPAHSNSPMNNKAVASLPTTSGASAEARIPPVAAAAVASAPSACAPAAAKKCDSPVMGTVDEYPQTVQELVMNGFPLSKVVHAFEIIGDNFDNLLSFLMSTST